MSTRQRTIRNWLRQINKKKDPYLFISPFYILFAIFMAYPLAHSVYLSFHRWPGYGPWKFVGLKNYLSLFTDEAFLASLRNVAFFMGFLVPLLIVMSLVIAVLLSSSSLRGSGIFRLFFIMPYVMVPTVTAIIFKIVLESNFGIANAFLRSINISPVPWIESKTWIKPTLILILTWQWLGFYMLIMLGGLQGIDLNLYEAARIDGANSVQIFFRITIPLMMRIILFGVIIASVWVFVLFDIPWLVSWGGPGYSAYTPGIYLYVTAFRKFSLGLASSASVVISLMLVAISFLWIRLLPKI